MVSQPTATLTDSYDVIALSIKAASSIIRRLLASLDAPTRFTMSRELAASEVASNKPLEINLVLGNSGVPRQWAKKLSVFDSEPSSISGH